MTPPISIVTCSFNQGRFIERTIRSVLDQGIDGLEYVVVDGGSTDETLFILPRHGSQLRWCSRKDAGQSDAINRGVRQTTGPIIGWVNSDDVYYPGAIAAVLEAFAANPDVDVVYGRGVHIDDADRELGPYGNEPWDLGRLAQWCYFCQPATFVRRSAMDRHGPLDEHLHFCMDYEYWLRLGRAGARFIFLDRVLAGARLHESTKTLGQRAAAAVEINDMLRRVVGRVDDFWLVNYAYAANEPRRLGPLRFQAAVMLSLLRAMRRWNGRIDWRCLAAYAAGKARKLAGRVVR